MFVNNNIDRDMVNDNFMNDDFDYNYNSLNEKIELDLRNEDYEKIEVPDFRDGRSGRFIHDFNTNKTGIIDVAGKRCFVMPLNRDKVLPPRSLFDLIQKMWDGYYKVDTEVVRETMHVIIPPIVDMKEVGDYIAKECSIYPIYKLEKYVGGGKNFSIELFFSCLLTRNKFGFSCKKIS